jgi:signal transduction histidine kinase/Na+/proline symporter
MRELAVPAVIVTGYVALLVAIAAWAERQEGRGRKVSSNPVVYALSLAVYASTWTFYGSVGLAARGGLLWLTVYLGPTLCAATWWWVLRPLVRLKERHRVTGLADLLALRYEKSQPLALLATGVIAAGLVPYLALQLKTMIATLAIVSGATAPDTPVDGATARHLGPPLVALMLVFTILFGLRRVRPTERHPGLVVALAAECVLKLVAFVAAGAFVTYGLFDGFGDLFRRALAAPSVAPDLLGGLGVVAWVSHLALSAVAVLLLPRQFHVAVVENTDVAHVRTAMWLFPLYLFLINLFVLPVALAGLLLGHPAAAADTFVLRLPLDAGRPILSWLVFLGGFSAGIGMMVVETIALATMFSNHVMLPAAERFSALGGLRRHVLPARWAAAAVILVAAYAYERAFGGGYTLASIGFISFAAVLQLAPPLLGGFLWRGASRVGAQAGLAAGFLLWVYTIVAPVLVHAGWLPGTLITEGPFGIEALEPEGLFDVHLDSISHAVLWTLFANISAFVVGSLLFPPKAEEVARVDRLIAPPAPRVAPAEWAPPLVDAREKRDRAAALLARYHGDALGVALADACLDRIGAVPGGTLSALQLAELQAEVETTLAAAIGSAGAHAAIRRDPIVTDAESGAISRAYADILAALHVSPAELQRKIDYHRERERLLVRDAESQRFLAAVSGLLAASLDLDATGRAGVRLAVPHLADAALLWLAPEGARPARAWLAHVDVAAERAGVAALEVCAATLGGAAPFARALAAHRAVPLRPDEAGWPAALAERLPRGGGVVLPLLSARAPLGALALLVDDSTRLRTPDDLAVSEEVARRLSLALENASLYLRAEEAVRARDEFLAVASHELKTPLTPLRIKIQTLERLVTRGNLTTIPPEKLLQLFGGAEAQVLRLVGLVDDLLDVTRLTSKRLKLRPEAMDLARAVHDVVERHASDASEAGCTVLVEADAPVTGTWDRLRIEQVVTNLLTNALKYAPGCRVSVTVDAEDGIARVAVRDEGPGIAAADQQRIFQPFERAVRYLEVSGFGLGLFIVRQIVEAHGGLVRLDSAPGRGTSFEVDLPREALAEVFERSAPAEANEASGVGPQASEKT